jgi:hypothetical protein
MPYGDDREPIMAGDYRYYATPTPATQRCDSCGVVKPMDEVFPDEGDIWACLTCIDAWEKQHGLNWADGTPIQEPHQKKGD